MHFLLYCLLITLFHTLSFCAVVSGENNIIKRVAVNDYIETKEAERKSRVITIEKIEEIKTEESIITSFGITRKTRPAEGYHAHADFGTKFDFDEVEYPSVPDSEQKKIIEEEMNVTILYPKNYKEWHKKIKESEVIFNFDDGPVVTLLGGRKVDDILGKENYVVWKYEMKYEKGIEKK